MYKPSYFFTFLLPNLSEPLQPHRPEDAAPDDPAIGGSSSSGIRAVTAGPCRR